MCVYFKWNARSLYKSFVARVQVPSLPTGTGNQELQCSSSSRFFPRFFLVTFSFEVLILKTVELNRSNSSSDGTSEDSIFHTRNH